MAVTAYAAKGDEERIRDAGAEGYVSKPISVMRFVEAVRSLLAAPRQGARSRVGEGAEAEAARTGRGDEQRRRAGNEGSGRARRRSRSRRRGRE